MDSRRRRQPHLHRNLQRRNLGLEHRSSYCIIQPHYSDGLVGSEVSFSSTAHIPSPLKTVLISSRLSSTDLYGGIRFPPGAENHSLCFQYRHTHFIRLLTSVPAPVPLYLLFAVLKLYLMENFILWVSIRLVCLIIWLPQSVIKS